MSNLNISTSTIVKNNTTTSTRVLANTAINNEIDIWIKKVDTLVPYSINQELN